MKLSNDVQLYILAGENLHFLLEEKGFKTDRKHLIILPNKRVVKWLMKIIELFNIKRESQR